MPNEPRKQRILIIESDETDSRRVPWTMQAMLEQPGHDYEFTLSGTLECGLARLSSRNVPDYDAILICLELPNGEGIETVLKPVAAARSASPLVVVTKDKTESTKIEALAQVPDIAAYFRREVDFETPQFVEAVEALVGNITH